MVRDRFVIVLFAGQVMVTLPASDDPAARIRDFYAAHRMTVVVGQVFGVVAAVLFVGFVVTLWRQAPGSGAQFILWSGVLVALASLSTNVPVLLLALLSHSSLSMTHALARAADITDAVLFGAIALFAMAAWKEALPAWLRILAAVTAVLALARAVLSPLGSAALDAIAPIGFLALVLALSIRMLTRHEALFAEHAG